MLVVQDKRALVLRSRNPERILSVIPTAKRMEHNGDTYVAVPHKRDEVKVLGNMGIKAPSPMLFYYDWAGRYTPFEAQRATAAFAAQNERCFILNGMGSGKTLATLWAYDYLRSIGIRHKLLVDAPLATLERTWGDEIFQHFPHLDFTVVYGDRNRRLKLLDRDADIYIINHDGLEVVAPALAKRADIDLVIVDEIAQVARNQRTDRWKFLNTVLNKQVPRWAWGLTGTPTPNDPTDAWAQCHLMRRGSVPDYFIRFRNQVMEQKGYHVWAPKEGAQKIVNEVMQPSIRFSRDECVDLPETMYQTLEVELTPEQKVAYKEMFTRLKTEADEGQIIALNEAVKINKLIQISCGIVYDTDGVERSIPSQPRLDAVKEIVTGAEAKVIVFVPFVSSIHHVAGYLQSCGITTECVYGDVSKSERDRIFRAFQSSGGPRVLVAQPASMSHGLTLTQANVIVWYAPITSNDIYEQACARITRPGQRRTQFIINIEGTPVERKTYARLRSKQKVQGLFLDLVASERDDIR